MYIDLDAHKLSLMKNIGINDTVTFTSGKFDLNNFNVNLGVNGMISGENDNSAFIGDNGGSVSITANLNAPSSMNPGNLGAIISSAANLGTTTITSSYQAQSNGANFSIKRSYDISPANNSGLNATLRFRYLDSELNGIPEDELDLWRYDGSTWEDMGFEIRDTANNYVELSGIDAFSLWTLTNDINPLPVALTYFSVDKVEDKFSFLEWETASEFNNYGFEIQRAISNSYGQLEWQSLDFVMGSGNSIEKTVYEYLDQFPTPGTNYYRLKQIDFDGNFEYSEIRSIAFENEKAIDVGLIYPNPGFRQSGEMYLPVICKNRSKIYIDIRDQFGKLVFTEKSEKEEGRQILQIDISQYTNGIYFIILNIGGEQFTQRFIVQGAD